MRSSIVCLGFGLIILCSKLVTSQYQTTGNIMNRLIIVRHSERMDEVDESGWKRMVANE